VKTIQKPVSLLKLLVLVATLWGCSPRSNILGKWQYSDGTTVEFFRDGTFAANTGPINPGEIPLHTSTTGKWSILSDGRLQLKGQHGGDIVQYEISGDRLTSIDADGTRSTATKVR
jgi:hypothetical protein